MLNIVVLGAAINATTCAGDGHAQAYHCATVFFARLHVIVETHACAWLAQTSQLFSPISKWCLDTWLVNVCIHSRYRPSNGIRTEDLFTSAHDLALFALVVCWLQEWWLFVFQRHIGPLSHELRAIWLILNVVIRLEGHIGTFLDCRRRSQYGARHWNWRGEVTLVSTVENHLHRVELRLVVWIGHQRCHNVGAKQIRRLFLIQVLSLLAEKACSVSRHLRSTLRFKSLIQWNYNCMND